MKKNSKILVIGDSCRDIFIYCDSNRLAPDVPVPILSVIDQVENPGMAKNVQRNIGKYIDCDIITNNNWYNITKTRYVHRDSNHMFIRVDSSHEIDPINLEGIDLDYDLIVISDYNKGFISEKDIQKISEIHPLVFLDTKKILGDWAKKCKFIKINNYEFLHSEKFIDKELNDKIIRTKGSEGCFFRGQNFPVPRKIDVKDTSGAGDSFMSALVIKFLQTSNIEVSIKFANEKASEVVSQIGVSTI